ncbi:hypothetical protein F5Y16DRAFT_416586 [Xylariaceae sp. FL0255]|nr:hypothetical protein F5Y16DRAFT_416586 [Xylariaceae sp. FL0255]
MNSSNDSIVTSANPAAEGCTLNYERCSKLHNLLVEHAWVASGRPLAELEQRSYFDHHGEGCLAVFFWVECIAPPPEMFSVPEEMFQEYNVKWSDRFLVLYTTNLGLGEHRFGLIYDQKLHRATMALGIEDIDFAKPPEGFNELCHPLETVLSNWVHMISIGRITASPDDAPNEKFGP